MIHIKNMNMNTSTHSFSIDIKDHFLNNKKKYKKTYDRMKSRMSQKNMKIDGQCIVLYINTFFRIH